MAIIDISKGYLYYQKGREKIRIDAWGKDGLRVRVTYEAQIDEREDWALLPKPETGAPVLERDEEAGTVSIRNGKIRAVIDRHGYLFYYNQEGKELVREYWRNRSDLTEYCLPLNYNARQFKPIIGGDWRLTAYFEAYDDERLYGLGQYQEKQLNRKGLTRLFVEQPCAGTRDAGPEPNRMGGGCDQTDGLLDLRGRYAAGNRGKLHRGDGPRSHDAR